MTETKQKALLVRLDRMGDLIATLPVDESLGPSDLVTWLIYSNLEFLTQKSLPVRTHMSLPPHWDQSISWREFSQFLARLKAENFSMAVVFHAPWWLSFALWLAKIPVRVGPQSQWHHFLFFTKKLKQNRSTNTKHEADYNFDLMNFALGKTANFPTPTLRLRAAPLAPDQEVNLFSDLRLGYVVIHPGMAGSARNWPASHYNSLIEKVIADQKKVVITGTPADQAWLKEIEPLWNMHPEVKWWVGQLNLNELTRVMSGALAIVGPSTGVLHLAASVGSPVLGLYSPISVQSPTRWAPRGAKAQALNPKVSCPEKFKCSFEACPYFDCMATISVTEVHQWIMKHY